MRHWASVMGGYPTGTNWSIQNPLVDGQPVIDPWPGLEGRWPWFAGSCKAHGQSVAIGLEDAQLWFAHGLAAMDLNEIDPMGKGRKIEADLPGCIDVVARPDGELVSG